MEILLSLAAFHLLALIAPGGRNTADTPLYLPHPPATLYYTILILHNTILTNPQHATLGWS